MCIVIKNEKNMLSKLSNHIKVWVLWKKLLFSYFKIIVFLHKIVTKKKKKSKKFFSTL